MGSERDREMLKEEEKEWRIWIGGKGRKRCGKGARRCRNEKRGEKREDKGRDRNRKRGRV